MVWYSRHVCTAVALRYITEVHNNSIIIPNYPQAIPNTSVFKSCIETRARVRPVSKKAGFLFDRGKIVDSVNARSYLIHVVLCCVAYMFCFSTFFLDSGLLPF